MDHLACADPSSYIAEANPRVPEVAARTVVVEGAKAVHLVALRITIRQRTILH